MDKKYTFSIPVEWTVCADVDIEASSHEEAMELARDADLPKDSEYMDSSFEINIECSESQNCSVIEVIKVDQTSLKDLPKLLGSLDTEEAKDRLQERLTEEGK